jgi:hypothetical protein
MRRSLLGRSGRVPGTTVHIKAEWSVGFRRNTSYYWYRFVVE